MQEKKAKLIVGFITYGELTAKYLSYFLPSLFAQDFSNFEVVVVDNSENEENNNKKYIKENYSRIDFRWAGENLGFARAYNQMIRKAKKRGVDYFMVINPDMILEKDALGTLVGFLDKNKEVASVSPKIFRWDFAKNKKTKIIDTCGIELLPGLRFRDIGQGEEDLDQYKNPEILGPSGAAGIYRLEALEKIKDLEEYFDEDMFMYKEDCDLVYRLKLAGLKSKCVETAIIYHDRTAVSGGTGNWQIAINRKNKSRQVKTWSLRNQLIIFKKYWYLQNFQNKISIVWYLLKMFLYILLFEQYLFGEFLKFFKYKSV